MVKACCKNCVNAENYGMSEGFYCIYFGNNMRNQHFDCVGFEPHKREDTPCEACKNYISDANFCLYLCGEIDVTERKKFCSGFEEAKK